MPLSASQKPRVLIETLGCKVNHYESQGLAAGFRQAGWEVVKKPPFEAVVINSCAVTAEAGRQSLQSVRRALQRYPGVLVALSGCAVLAESEKVLEIKELGAIFGNRGKKDLVAVLTEQLADGKSGRSKTGLFDFSGELAIDLLRADSVRGRRRAVVKVQDGCNSFCRYCIIPYLRGRCRSLEPEQVLAECRELAVAGFREVVLTGIHLGRYGDDADSKFSLTSLVLQMLNQLPGLRIRLGSLQPHEITPEMVALLLDPAASLCEHLHLSLQSASDRVLGAMGRPYRRSDIEAIFSQLNEGAGRIAIGTDLIVGFPAETAAAFAETCDLIEKVPLTYLHVFPYSPRQGTVAASWPDRVPVTEKKMRAKRLAELGRAKHNEFAQANLGRELKVLLETRKEDKQEGMVWFGHSRNYLPTIIPISDGMKQIDAGDEVVVIPRQWENGRLTAEKI